MNCRQCSLSALYNTEIVTEFANISVKLLQNKSNKFDGVKQSPMGGTYSYKNRHQKSNATVPLRAK